MNGFHSTALSTSNVKATSHCAVSMAGVKVKPALYFSLFFCLFFYLQKIWLRDFGHWKLSVKNDIFVFRVIIFIRWKFSPSLLQIIHFVLWQCNRSHLDKTSVHMDSRGRIRPVLFEQCFIKPRLSLIFTLVHLRVWGCMKQLHTWPSR